MKWLCWPNSQCLSLSISRWLFIKVSILSHIYSQCLKKTPFVIWKQSNFTWFTNIIQSMWNRMWNNYYKFHKGYKSFQNLEVYIHFLTHNYRYYFHINIFQSTKTYIKIIYILLGLCFIIMQKIVKLLFNVGPWFRFKNIHPRKHYNVTT